MCELLVGLPEVRVRGVEQPGDGLPLTVHVACPDDWQQDCGQCGSRGWVKQRTVVRLTDLPVFGRPVVLAWHKVRRTCPNTDCPQGSWTTSDERIAGPRCAVTQRAGRWLTQQVGMFRRAVSMVAGELGCDWHTVNDTMIAYGQLLVDDPDRIGPVTAIGMDETLFTRTGAYRTQQWATTFADVGSHRLIDIAQGKDAESVIGWLDQRPQSWLEAIEVGTLDMASSYRSIYHQILPQAVLVVDPFHLVKHANLCLDRVRCAVQNQTLGHRGHKHDPLYRSRRLLTKATERLTVQGHEKLRGLLAAGDPDGHVGTAWAAKEAVRGIYTQPPETAAEYLAALTDDLRQSHRPEHVRRLGNTLRNWGREILAWHTTKASNGPTEGQNNLIKATKRVGFGFRTFRNYRIRVLLDAGGVNWDLLPTLTPR
jgi:transposase